MPEYRAVRKHHSLLEICRTPDLAAEVTITAAERLGVDAAIIFADLLLPLTPMGLDFEFIADEGPCILAPIRTAAQIRALRTDRTEDLIYVARAIEQVAAHFSSPRSDGDQLGIIGFCGAPFTLASYMIEGGSSRDYIETKRLMYASTPSSPAPEGCHSEPGAPSFAASSQRVGSANPAPSASPHLPLTTDHLPLVPAWPILMEKLVTVLADFAAQQVAAGADVIQVFDSWAGALSPTDYRAYVLAPTTDLIARIRALGVPVIYFGVDTASLLPAMRETTADVLGLDWRTPLDQAWRALGTGVAVQGNLDPIALFAPPDVLHARVAEVLAAAAGRPGHIFNLGHGIVPSTPVENVQAVVRMVKEFRLEATRG
jgi:uroporphyrinogen decarboxylase